MNKMKRILINIYQYLSIDKLLIVLKWDTHFNKELDYWLKKKESYKTKELEKDIRKCYVKYLTSPAEYFLFGFNENQSGEYRGEFLSDKKRIRILKKRCGLDLFDELSDKYAFYCRTKEYFNRKVAKIKIEKDRSIWDEFSNDLNVCFLKPLKGTWGVGCSVHSLGNDINRTKVFEYILKAKQGFLVEECIFQCQEMAIWNESSCNTIRLPIIYTNSQVRIIQPFLRVGRKGMVVDNAGSGGLFAVIDEKTGVIKTDGIDKDGNIYTKHPDSNIVFKGSAIPKWNELVILAERIFKQHLYNHKYIGFDFALTDDGWCLIEGNWGQFVGQYIERRGVKKEFLYHISK